MRAIARAKINLILRIIGARDDGLHELESVMQSIELADELTIATADRTDVTFRFEADPFEIARPDLVQRAVEAFNAATGKPIALAVDVLKRVPPQSGLGGGSADAAAALLVCDELTGRSCSATDLMGLAASIGADVPFCLQGGTAAVRGSGDKVSAMASPATFWWVVCTGAPGLATADVYARFDEIGSPSGKTPQAAWDGLVHALRTEQVETVAAMLHNDLEHAAFDLMPSLARTKQALLAAGALGAVMTGSGSAVCGLAADEGHARTIAGALRGTSLAATVVSSAPRGAEITT